MQNKILWEGNFSLDVAIKKALPHAREEVETSSSVYLILNTAPLVNTEIQRLELGKYKADLPMNLKKASGLQKNLTRTHTPAHKTVWGVNYK